MIETLIIISAIGTVCILVALHNLQELKARNEESQKPVTQHVQLVFNAEQGSTQEIKLYLEVEHPSFFVPGDISKEVSLLAESCCRRWWTGTKTRTFGELESWLYAIASDHFFIRRAVVCDLPVKEPSKPTTADIITTVFKDTVATAVAAEKGLDDNA